MRSPSTPAGHALRPLRATPACVHRRPNPAGVHPAREPSCSRECGLPPVPQPPQPWHGHGLAQLLRGHCSFAALPRRRGLARRTGREPRRAIAPAALHAAHRGPMRQPLPQAHAQWLAQTHGVPADAGAWRGATAPRWPAAATA